MAREGLRRSIDADKQGVFATNIRVLLQSGNSNENHDKSPSGSGNVYHVKCWRLGIQSWRKSMKLLRVVCLAMSLSLAPVGAQSLKPDSPAPLQAGINEGTVDNFVGPQYWYFTAQPGHTHLHAQFKSMGLLGNPYQSQITITLSDAANTWHTPKVLSSASNAADCNFDGDLKKPTKLLICVAPPSGGLVRTGGTYQLEATGDVSFGEKSTADPIIGTYKQMAGYTSLLGASKFLADGSVETASGANGRWKLFDKDTQTYVVDIDGQDRHSLQYIPGRGLCDGDIIIFQELK